MMRSSRAMRRITAITGCLLLAACGSPSTVDPPTVEVPQALPPSIDFDPEIGDPPSGEDCAVRESYAPDPAIDATAARETLLESDEVVIGISQTTNLMGYREAATGTLGGFDIAIATAVATAIMGDDKAIRWVPMTSGEREPALSDGLVDDEDDIPDIEQVDMVVRTMTMTCSRWENVEFSSEYYSGGQRLVAGVSSGIESLDDLTDEHLVCTGAGSTSPSQIAAHSEAQPVTVRDFNDCLPLLQQGVVDAITTDDTILAGMAIQDPTLAVVGDAFSEEPYGIAIRKDNVELVRYVNGALEQMRADGTWDAIYNEWLAEHLGEAGAPAPQYRD